MKVVVVGGVAGGLTAASNIKKYDRNVEVTVFEKGNDVSYGACGMPYNLMFLDSPVEKLYALSLEDIRDKRGIDYRLNHDVIDVNFKNKTVTVKNDKETFEAKYDKLVIATGAKNNKIPIFDGEKDSFYFKTLNDLRKIKKYIRENDVKKVCLIGAGYVNLEVAEALKENGKEVFILEKLEKILPAFSEEIREKALKKLEEKEVKVHLGVDIIEKKGKTLITNKGNFNADMFIISIGVTPNSELFDVKKGTKNAILPNRFMETSEKDVYTAGDITLCYNRLIDDYVYYPLGTNANKQGRIVAYNIVYGNKREYYGIVQTAAFKLFDYSVATTGLTEHQMKELKIDYEKTVVIAKTRGAYPGVGKQTVIIFHDKRSRKLLGCQIIGEDVVAKRIDIVAGAISTGITVDDFAWLDLSYSPPFAPVWDPLLIAGQKAITK